MKFVDEAIISVTAGKGGKAALAFAVKIYPEADPMAATAATAAALFTG